MYINNIICIFYICSAQQKTDKIQDKKPHKSIPPEENSAATTFMNVLSGRLNGHYNIQHPHFEKITKAYAQRKQSAPMRGLGAYKEEILPLNVAGQVQRLLDEATSEANLAQMYYGWQPWN